jgi:hypothetical protein
VGVTSCVGGHARALAKSFKSCVYDSVGVCYLSCAHGSYVPCSSEGVHHGVRGVLCARIHCATASVSLLLPLVLRLGVASLDSIGDPTYGDLRDPV